MTGTGQVQVTAPVAAGIRSAVIRAGVGFILAGVLLVGVTVTLVLTAPREGGFLDPIALGGGANGGLLVMLAGFMLWDARKVVSGQTFLAGRARRVQRSLLLLFVLSVVISGICAYGLVRVADDEPIAGFLTLPLTSCPLTALAVVVARSVLRPTTDRG
ncbi:MAG: hypothetical protein ACRDTE_25140 [Pseudonocardiaceae bacterium]